MDWQTLCNDEAVRRGFWKAWKDSQPDADNAHEEGGFVVAGDQGLEIVRWPVGDLHEISTPSHAGCKIEGKEIIASFHTHPHSGRGYFQEPSVADVKLVRNDADLKGANYIGEFVFSFARTYLISPDGQVQDIGRTAALFGPKENRNVDQSTEFDHRSRRAFRCPRNDDGQRTSQAGRCRRAAIGRYGLANGRRWRSLAS